jgi:hypothetical protein
MANPVALHSGSDDLLRVAIAAHLARYKGLSRAHTNPDLQVFLRWCGVHHVVPIAHDAVHAHAVSRAWCAPV